MNIARLELFVCILQSSYLIHMNCRSNVHPTCRLVRVDPNQPFYLSPICHHIISKKFNPLYITPGSENYIIFSPLFFYSNCEPIISVQLIAINLAI